MRVENKAKHISFFSQIEREGGEGVSMNPMKAFMGCQGEGGVRGIRGSAARITRFVGDGEGKKNRGARAAGEKKM